MNATSRDAGFTLIELMVVVIIIAALAGMVLPKVIPASDDAKARIALGSLAGVKVGLQMFRLHNDRYPTTEEGLAALQKQPSLAPDWRGPYLEKSPKDPWGHTFQYRYPGTRNPTGFDIWSVGVDGTSGTEDDVWPEE